jgi:serine/threonine-protein kinase
VTIQGRVLAARYAVGELLGRGGMAEVYRATDRVLDRSVAVKVLGSWLADDATFVERFRREALAAARISHPNLVAVYDAGSEDGIQYIVMELVPGETLAGVLASRGRLDPDRAAQVATSAADALEVAHASGLVHRDVKPANVMVMPDGRTKLMDLGIARSLDGETITRASSVLGTAGYLSPEQARGDRVDHRSDIYSLGCVLFEMLAGRQPFEADSPVAVAYKHVNETPAFPASLQPPVPPALEAVTLRAMEKDPAARFQSAADMKAALDDRTVPIAPVTATEPMASVEATRPLPLAPTGTLPRRADRPPRRRRWIPVLLGLTALALLGGLVFALLGDDPAGLPAGSSSPSVTPTPSSPSPPSTPSPTPPADPVKAVLEDLLAVVDAGVAGGSITDEAAQVIRDRAEGAVATFRDGDSQGAIEELEELRGAVEELVDDGQIHNSQEQKLDKAIEDLADQMILLDPPESD